MYAKFVDCAADEKLNVTAVVETAITSTLIPLVYAVAFTVGMLVNVVAKVSVQFVTGIGR